MSIAYDPAPTPDGAEPSFPPLLTGVRVPAGVDPFAKAVAAAASPDGVDAGAVFWSERDDALDAAIVLAPETPLDQSMAVVFAVANGMGDALGALSPPEVAVTWAWPDLIKVNGADAGVFRLDAATRDLATTPNWLVVGATVQMTPIAKGEPGDDPTVTALVEEGVVDLTRARLLESWARHSLVWINRWIEDGFRPIHDAWVARVEGRGESVAVRHAGALREGVFLGLDERGGMLLKTNAAAEAEAVEAKAVVALGIEALGLDGLLDHPRSWPKQSADERP